MSINKHEDNCEYMYKDLASMNDLGVRVEAHEMRELLFAIYESTGPGSSEQQFKDAYQAVADYINKITK